MTKAELRRKYRKQRSELGANTILKYDDLLLIQFQKANIPFVDTLLSYFPIAEMNEPDTDLFLQYLQFINPHLEVCYPVTDFTNCTMKAMRVGPSTEFLPSSHNIPEPADGIETDPQELDIVFVPLLAFDGKGNRVGYGKGFYDRFLKLTRPGCIKAGFSYFGPTDGLIDTDVFDVPLDLCITPQEVYVF